MTTAQTSIYAHTFPEAFAAGIDLTGHTLKMGLLSSGYTPNLQTDTTWSGISSNEITGPGYTAGGATLGSVASTLTAAGSWSHTWTAATVYAYGQVIRPTSSNGFLYRCVQAGTSGGGQPTWPTTTGLTVTDSGVIWAAMGSAAWVFTSAAASWSSATFDADYGAIYDSSSGDLLCLVDFGGTQSPSAQTFSVPPDATNGWWLLSPPS